MTPEEAIQLVREHDYAAAKCGIGATKVAEKRLERAAAKLLAALLGRKPTPEEVQKAITW